MTASRLTDKQQQMLKEARLLGSSAVDALRDTLIPILGKPGWSKLVYP